MQPAWMTRVPSPIAVRATASKSARSGCTRQPQSERSSVSIPTILHRRSSPSMEKTRLWFAVAALLLLFGTRAGAQSTIRGSVVDSVSREVLVGANVYLPGTALGSVTDREGRFQIERVPPGAHIVRASYIGYRSRDVRLTVTSAETSITFRLPPDVLEGSEVVVTAQRRGQVAAI